MTAALIAAVLIAAELIRRRRADAVRGRLSLPLDRPHGLRGVTNPVPASGGADPEAVEDSRDHAPPAVHTLDRAVSLADYEAIARAMPGVARAVATRRAGLEQATVVVAVAAGPGATLSPQDLREIQRELERRSDPTVCVEVVGDDGSD